jgi:hypothetical protein
MLFFYCLDGNNKSINQAGGKKRDVSTEVCRDICRTGQHRDQTEKQPQPGRERPFSERLLSLRRLMDQCIQSWLCFEERVNQLQDHYGLELPDEIPDMLFKNLGLEELEIFAGPIKGPPKGNSPSKRRKKPRSQPAGHRLQQNEEGCFHLLIQAGPGFL